MQRAYCSLSIPNYTWLHFNHCPQILCSPYRSNCYSNILTHAALEEIPIPPDPAPGRQQSAKVPEESRNEGM